MAVCGGYSLYLELNGLLNVAEILQTQGAELLATTLDSVACVLASITSKELAGDEEPARHNRLLWAFALAFIAVGLLVVGGLKTVQSASVVTALPLIPVIAVLTCSMLVWLKEDFGQQAAPQILVKETED